MADKMSREEMREWIAGQSWYQTIELHDGLITPGKFCATRRAKYLDKIDFKGKSVLDIGCNSGQYCLYAKKMGADKVVGADIDQSRLQQARMLSVYEDYEIEFKKMGLFEAASLGQYDIVLCIAVVTEISDLVGAIKSLRNVIGSYAFLEMDIAKPVLYLPSLRRWFKKVSGIPITKAVSEMRITKRGDWMISPTLEVLSTLFGKEFSLKRLGRGDRYDVVEVTRIGSSI